MAWRTPDHPGASRGASSLHQQHRIQRAKQLTKPETGRFGKQTAPCETGAVRSAQACWLYEWHRIESVYTSWLSHQLPAWQPAPAPWETVWCCKSLPQSPQGIDQLFQAAGAGRKGSGGVLPPPRASARRRPPPLPAAHTACRSHCLLLCSSQVPSGGVEQCTYIMPGPACRWAVHWCGDRLQRRQGGSREPRRALTNSWHAGLLDRPAPVGWHAWLLGWST